PAFRWAAARYRKDGRTESAPKRRPAGCIPEQCGGRSNQRVSLEHFIRVLVLHWRRGWCIVVTKAPPGPDWALSAADRRQTGSGRHGQEAGALVNRAAVWLALYLD